MKVGFDLRDLVGNKKKLKKFEVEETILKCMLHASIFAVVICEDD